MKNTDKTDIKTLEVPLARASQMTARKLGIEVCRREKTGDGGGRP
ncbi:MAG: hypothetical protein AB1512_27520 [Thermodesulfobacteriota bacterium]